MLSISILHENIFETLPKQKKEEGSNLADVWLHHRASSIWASSALCILCIPSIIGLIFLLRFPGVGGERKHATNLWSPSLPQSESQVFLKVHHCSPGKVEGPSNHRGFSVNYLKKDFAGAVRKRHCLYIQLSFKLSLSDWANNWLYLRMDKMAQVAWIGKWGFR